MLHVGLDPSTATAAKYCCHLLLPLGTAAWYCLLQVPQEFDCFKLDYVDNVAQPVGDSTFPCAKGATW